MTQEWWDYDQNIWINRLWVNGVSYGTAGALLTLNSFSGVQNFADVYLVETRTYNSQLQMIKQRTVQGSTVAMDLEYVFTNGTSTNNDGRILERRNLQCGETVQYTYDNLNRLLTTATTSTAWGLSWDLDGFGNRWAQAQTKGTAPGNTISFDQTTNRVNTSQYGYDANGNMTAMPGASGGLTYDVDNRLLDVNMNGSLENYSYLADNKRAWKQTNQSGAVVEQYYLYGVGGQRIATYSAAFGSGVLTLSYASKDVYFWGRAIWQNVKAVTQDRLGSVMAWHYMLICQEQLGAYSLDFPITSRSAGRIARPCSMRSRTAASIWN